MRIRKSVAGIGALGLVAAGLAVATAPAAQAATGGPYTLNGAPFNAAGGASYVGTPEVELTATQLPGGTNVLIEANISVGPTTTSFAGFDENAYRLDAYVRIDDGPQIQLTGEVGTVDVPPSTVSYPLGTTASATVNLGDGDHDIVLQSLVVDSNGPSSGGGFATQFSELSGFDAAYNLSPIIYGGPNPDVSQVLGNPPTVPIGLTETIDVAGPTASITGSSNQIAGVTGYVRGGSTVTAQLTGTTFPVDLAVGSFTTEFCDVTGAGCDAPVTNTLSSGSTGGLTGGVSVPSSTTTGERALKISSGSASALVEVTVLAAPTITISPASGGPGTEVGWEGENFNPLGFGVAHGSIANPNGFCAVPDGPIGGPPCNDPVGNYAVGPYIAGPDNDIVGWTALADGSASGTVIVTDPETIYVQVSQKSITGGASANTNLDMTSLGQGTSKTAAFEISSDRCRADGADGDSPDVSGEVEGTDFCNTTQNINAVVNPGSLTQDTGVYDVDITTAAEDGEEGSYEGLATTTTGDGVGLVVTIDRDADLVATVTVDTLGYGYNDGDTATIAAGATGDGSTAIVLTIGRVGGTLIDLGEVTTSTVPQTLTAGINPIRVTDTRGGTAAWTLTATVTTSVASLTAGDTIPNTALSLGAADCAGTSASTAGVAEGTGDTFGSSTLLVCDGPTVAGATGTTGGEWIASAPVSLVVPAFQAAANDYTGVITFTLT